MSKKTGVAYHYTACGLDDVYLLNLPLAEDRAGDRTITIPNINQLHMVLCGQVARKAGPLSGREVRFLRGELRLRQSELAKLLHKDTQTIGRWERGETRIDGTSETLLRAVALEGGSGTAPSIRELTAWAAVDAAPHPYRIEASDPEAYRPAA